MTTETLQAGKYPFRLDSASGLCVQVNANGSIRRIDHRDLILNLFLGNEMEGAPANLYLRRHGEGIEAVPLLGPRSFGAVCCDERGLTVSGVWRGIRFGLSLALSESVPAWFWHVDLENTGGVAERLDLIYVQDLALAHYGAVRVNEYYVSQYVDHTPLCHPDRGFVLASRQNLSMGGRNPWCLIGALRQGVSFATDALQVHGLSTRAGRAPAALIEGLPGARRQHEHSMAAIQDAPLRLQPGARAERGFFGWFEADHPAATSDADLVFVDRALALSEASPVRAGEAVEGPIPPRRASMPARRSWMPWSLAKPRSSICSARTYAKWNVKMAARSSPSQMLLMFLRNRNKCIA